MEISKIIFEHFVTQENLSRIDLEKTEPIEINIEKLNRCIKDTKERLKIKLSSNGICSTLLIDQISLHRAGYGEKYGDKIEFFNASEILDLIEKIEKKKVTGTHFSNEPLKGYLHVHHNTYAGMGYSLIRNVREYWFNNNGELKKNRIKEFSELLSKYKDNFQATAIDMHQKAVSRKQLKGEWLIYKEFNGINYYLCLASHREGKDRKESDSTIFNSKIVNCLNEFSELA